MADETDILQDDPFITAGEYSLGVLEGEELVAARRLLLADRNFIDAVDWWDMRFAAMAEAGGALRPSDSVWRAIEARLTESNRVGEMDAAAVRSRAPNGWSIATALGGLAAAAAALVLFLSTPAIVEGPPTAIPTTAQKQLIAQLADEETGRKLAGVIDPDGARLSLSIGGLEAEAGKTPELWVIPAGGAPVSLGAIPQTGAFSRDLDPEETRLLAEGATLAVTFEDDTGQRHETPTMPILLAGTLDQV